MEQKIDFDTISYSKDIKVVNLNATKDTSIPKEIWNAEFTSTGIVYGLYEFYKGWLIDDNYLDNVLSDSIQVPSDSIKYALDGFTLLRDKGEGRFVNINCFKCHSSQINDQWVAGLGNTLMDYQKSKYLETQLYSAVHRLSSDKNHRSSEFSKLYKATVTAIQTANPMVNPAFRLEEASSVILNPADLSIENEDNEVVNLSLGSDVPPLWNTKYKKIYYHNGMGEGSLKKLAMQITLLGANDTTVQRQNLQMFDKIEQWINTLEPPKYPGKLDSVLLDSGAKIYRSKCSKCHGKIEDGKLHYPNLVVPFNKIKTDSYYGMYMTTFSKLPEWYNKSWFATSEPSSRLNPKYGYLAPPLIGIWASAPYFHNGSVPNLMGVLSSDQRPDYWEPVYEANNYETAGSEVGLKYQERTSKSGRFVYDTSIPGYANVGHYFSDKLSEQQKRALLEYLKSL
ncbi:MAG: hypothetical protein AAFO69_00645 [Bacteroidota bacterium]